MRQRLHVEAAEEMVHRRIARHQHLLERLDAQHSSERFADEAAQFARPVQFVLQAAHHVGPVASLRVERGLDPLNFAAAEIDYLDDERGRAQVDNRTLPSARLDGHPRVVGEHAQRPLLHFDHNAVPPRTHSRPGASPRGFLFR